MDLSGEPRVPPREEAVYALSKRLGGRHKRSGRLGGNKKHRTPNRVVQCFPKLFDREFVLASKNNPGSSHPHLRKYKVSRW